MRAVRLVWAAVLAACPLPALAVEGLTLAGPIGGNDIRSAVLPPPGVYVGASGSAGGVIDSWTAAATRTRSSRLLSGIGKCSGPSCITCPT